MQARDIMSTEVVTVRMDDSLRDVKHLFDTKGFHHVLVVDGPGLFGVISDRDLLEALSPRLGTASETGQDVATLNKRAHQVLTRQPVTLSPDADIYEIIGVFNSHTISCIPIVDEFNSPVGVVSWRDILRAIEERYERRRAAAAKP